MGELKRILFVDDETRVLQGIRRMLHGKQSDWKLDFCDSGYKALEMLDKDPFDVVVSDLRMPSMDGVQLMNEVMTRHPNIVRIVLSGLSDENAILRYVGKTHIYLSKPCDAETLITTIQRACVIRDLLAQPDLQKIISSIEKLPSLPSLYLELLEEIKNPEPSVGRITKIISKDMAMIARILQLVNSAYFGFYGKVTDLERAIILLGTRTIEALVLSFKVFSQFDQEQVHAFRIESLMNHGTSTGSLTRVLSRAQQQGQNFISDALTAGLLHDIGKLILSSTLPDEYSKVLEMVHVHRMPLWKAEKELFGATHAEVGAYLVGLWGLPETVVEALAFHHCPHESSSRQFSPLLAVHIADLLEHEINPGEMVGPLPEFDMNYLNTLGLASRLDDWRDLCREACQGRNVA